MAIARLARHAKRPYGFCAKMTAVAIMGLCFIFVWSMFSTSSSSVTTQRESFEEIAEPVPANSRVGNPKTQSIEKEPEKHESSRKDQKVKIESDLESKKDEKRINGSAVSNSFPVNEHESRKKDKQESPNEEKEKNGSSKLPNEGAKDNNWQEDTENEESEKEEEEGEVVDGREKATDGQIEGNGDVEGEGGLIETVDQEVSEKADDGSDGSKSTGKKSNIKGPLFDPKAHYSWRLCSTRSKHNYIPCVDIESGTGRLQSYRHTERSCPRTPPLCLVPLPHESYGSPVRWPESKLKV